MNEADRLAELRKLIEDRQKIDEQQNKQLNEILFCLKGSDSLNIEGVIPMQKRMEKEINELLGWKREVNVYLGIITSRKLWQWIMRIVVFIAIGFMLIRYGWQWTVNILKELK
jgi:hypothetical protein